ncbi:erythromycin esterase family protein [Kitasatospora sp. NPDC051853]|uniref:erythromycin esterase family protein n=1 Tax=Kitasatospora sp. NPDC051853 TaxID=3364058 RepID=UPI0037919164
MTERGMRFGRRRLLVAAGAVAVGTGVAVPAVGTPPAAAAPADGGEDRLVRALEHGARPLATAEPGGRSGDLWALAGMIGGAKVVGLGEATHGSHEFFALKERLFRHLVEEKGFTTFALEMSWTSGLRIDSYVRGETGGDAVRLVREEFGGSPWERAEFASLIGWMREYNRRRPGRPLRFTGDDIGAPRLGDDVFRRVVGHVRTAAPSAAPRLEALYAPLRPLDDVFSYLGRPVAERRAHAARAAEALELVAGGGAAAGEAGAWAEQHARVIARTFEFLTLDVTDPATVTAAELLRDRTMAENTAWWQRHVGGKVLVSAHNGHVGYLATDTALYPKTQGAFLRDTLGRDYLAIGTTFAGGSFLTKGSSLGSQDWKTVTVPPAAPGSNEHLLDRVRHRDFYLDLRTVPAPARRWLETARPTYEAGSVFRADPLPTLAPGRAYDLLVHLHHVRAADRLPERAG